MLMLQYLQGQVNLLILGKELNSLCRKNQSDLPDSCLIWMVGFETGEVLVVWVWLTLEAPKAGLCCSCLGDCCLGNWASIWAGEPTRVLGDGSLAEATFTPAAEPPVKVKVKVKAVRMVLVCLTLEEP